jgi:hypothetical protein
MDKRNVDAQENQKYSHDCGDKHCYHADHHVQHLDQFLLMSNPRLGTPARRKAVRPTVRLPCLYACEHPAGVHDTNGPRDPHVPQGYRGLR